MITVQVFSRSSGQPRSGVRVTLIFPGYGPFGGHQSPEGNGYTDQNGKAYFNIDPCEGEVWVDGDLVGRGYLNGVVPVST